MRWLERSGILLFSIVVLLSSAYGDEPPGESRLGRGFEAMRFRVLHSSVLEGAAEPASNRASNSLTLRLGVSAKWDFELTSRLSWASEAGREPLTTQAPMLGAYREFMVREGKASLALNSELPGMDSVSLQRTTVMAPGIIAKASWAPPGSRWSGSAKATVRYWVYRESQTTSPRSKAGKGKATDTAKPDGSFTVTPLLNFRLKPEVGLRTGLIIDLKHKLGSQIGNWERSLTPLMLGMTWLPYPSLEVFGFFSVAPFEEGALKLEKSRWGLWVSGTVL